MTERAKTRLVSVLLLTLLGALMGCTSLNIVHPAAYHLTAILKDTGTFHDCGLGIEPTLPRNATPRARSVSSGKASTCASKSFPLLRLRRETLYLINPGLDLLQLRSEPQTHTLSPIEAIG
jgi:hypothetical protein